MFTALASGGARAISIAVSLVSIPIVLRHLGAERFGLWVTITSVTAFVGVADLGLGSGLINLLARAHGNNDKIAAGKYVSSTFYALLTISVLIGIFFLSLYPQIEWPDLLRAKSPLGRAETGPAVLMLVGSVIIGLPLSLAQRVHLAHQEGFKASLGNVFGSLCVLAGLLIAVSAGSGLPFLVLAAAGGPVLGGLVNWLIIWFRSDWLRPSFSSVSTQTVKQMSKVGALFFLLGVASLLSYNIDNLVIARIMGPQHVTVFSVPFKLFFVIPTLLGFGMQALWPAYGEAIARGDVSWVRQALNRSFILSISIALPAAFLLFLFARSILAVWVGSTLDPPSLLLAGLALWVVLNGLTGPIAAFLNGAAVVNFQVWTATLATVANVTVSILLVRSLGVAGAILGTCAAQLVFIIFPSLVFISRLLRNVTGLSDSYG